MCGHVSATRTMVTKVTKAVILACNCPFVVGFAFEHAARSLRRVRVVVRSFDVWRVTFGWSWSW